jgi:hypothetical protein
VKRQPITTSCVLVSVLGAACSPLTSRLYVVESPRAVAFDEAFSLTSSTMLIEETGPCVKIPLDMSVSLLGLESTEQVRFRYVVSPLDARGNELPLDENEERTKTLRFQIIERKDDYHAEQAAFVKTCEALRDATGRSAGTFSLSDGQDAPDVSQVPPDTETILESGRGVPQSLLIKPEDLTSGYVHYHKRALVVRYDKRAPRVGDQLRLGLQLELPEQEHGKGFTEIDLRKVRKPRGWVALLIGVSLLGAGTLGILYATERRDP